jgi:hypothetical protein
MILIILSRYFSTDLEENHFNKTMILLIHFIKSVKYEFKTPDVLHENVFDSFHDFYIF